MWAYCLPFIETLLNSLTVSLTIGFNLITRLHNFRAHVAQAGGFLVRYHSGVALLTQIML